MGRIRFITALASPWMKTWIPVGLKSGRDSSFPTIAVVISTSESPGSAPGAFDGVTWVIAAPGWLGIRSTSA